MYACAETLTLVKYVSDQKSDTTFVNPTFDDYQLMLMPHNDIFNLNVLKMEVVFIDRFFSAHITLEAKFIQTY